MQPIQQILAITGVVLAVTVYLVYKFVKWRRANSAYGLRPAPKMRPKGTSKVPPAAPVAPETPIPAAATPERSFDSAVPAPPAAPKRTPSATAAAGADPDEDYPYAGTDDYVLGPITPALAAMMPVSPEGRAQQTKRLRNAGYYEPHAWHNFAATRYLAIMLPLVFFGVLLVLAPAELENLLLTGLVVGPAVGWALPGVLVQSRAQERLREIENAMPDMLDLLNMCVSQGMTMPRSLGRVGKELQDVYPALSKELKIVTDQARVGSLSQALENFSQRVDVPEVHSFTSLLIQTEKMGTSLSQALTDYSDGMRENIRQRADQKANAATFKLLFPTVLCLMPAVYLFLLGPAIIQLNGFFASGGTDALNSGIPANVRTE